MEHQEYWVQATLVYPTYLTQMPSSNSHKFHHVHFTVVVVQEEHPVQVRLV